MDMIHYIFSNFIFHTKKCTFTYYLPYQKDTGMYDKGLGVRLGCVNLSFKFAELLTKIALHKNK